GAERRIVLRTWKEIVDALVVRAVRPEGLSPRVELVPPRIHHPAGEHLEAARSRLHPPDAAAVETPHPPGRLDIAVRVDALVDVERAIGPPAERVDEMMGVGAAESAKDDSLLVRPAVAVRVLEIEQLVGIAHVEAAVADGDTGRHLEPLGEDDGRIGAAVAVAVLQHVDLVVGYLTRLRLRVCSRADDPEAPALVPRHPHGLPDHGLGGEEVDFEAVGHLELLELVRSEEHTSE